MGYQDADDRPHAPLDDARWQESDCVWFADWNAGLTGFFRIGQHPAQATGAVLAYVARSDGPDWRGCFTSEDHARDSHGQRVGAAHAEAVAPRVMRYRWADAACSADVTFADSFYEPRGWAKDASASGLNDTINSQGHLECTGRLTGSVTLAGEEIVIDALAHRDRSWGVRPVGSRDPQPIPGHMMPAFFWQWTPLNLEGGSLFFHINADENGNPWNTRAAWAADGAGIEDIVEGRGTLDSTLAHGTRWPTGGELALDLPHAGERAPARLTLEPVARFQMKGLGYTHPVWGHGVHHGPLKVEREDYDLASLDPAQLDNRHVQMLCKVDGDAQGMGVFEQLVLGAYRPLGLEGI